MSQLTSLERAKQLNEICLRRALDARLLGEAAEFSQEEGWDEAIRSVRSWDPLREFPDLVAAAIVAIAQQDSDGAEIWPHVKRRLGFGNGRTFGEFFEGYLTARHLADFEHLVEAHAARFRSRVLAHSLIPRRLAQKFVRSVIRLAVEDPATFGADGAGIQAWLERNPPSLLPLAIQRFVVHGGRVAEDLIDRCLVIADSLRAGVPADISGIPEYLAEEIRAWIAESPAARSGRLAGRFRSPRLRLDSSTGRMYAELPYVDQGEADWLIQFSSTALQRIPASTPLWLRTGPAIEVEVDAPFERAAVSLVSGNRTLLTTQFPSLMPQTPALFFSCRDGRVLRNREVIEGTEWNVVHLASGSLESDAGQTLERMPPPAGAWGGYIVERYAVTPSATTVSLVGINSTTTWRIRRDAPQAELRCSPLPVGLHPLSDAALAFEHALPEVWIPNRPGSSQLDETYLHLWQLSVSDAEGESASRWAHHLSPSPSENGWLVGLADLIPDEDVGEWRLEVRGPLGGGFVRDLVLLPDLQLRLPKRRGFAGHGKPRVVEVECAGDMLTLEQQDASEQTASARWILTDANLNGRIPFTVRHTETRRSASALIRLPTFDWAWRDKEGRHLGRMFEAVAVGGNELDVTLELKSEESLSCELQCFDSHQTVIQTASLTTTGRSVAKLNGFGDTIRSADSVVMGLALVLPDEHPPVRVPVGLVAQRVQVEALVPSIDGDDLLFEWQQAHVDGEVTASLMSRWRPWDKAEDAPVYVTSAGNYQARFPGFALRAGSFRLQIRLADPWLGTMLLTSKGLSIGTAQEVKEYFARQGHDSATDLERAASVVGRGRNIHLEALRDRASSELAMSLAKLIAQSLTRPMERNWAGLPWFQLEAVFNRSGDATLVLVEAIASASESSNLRRFVQALGLVRWRSFWLIRDRIPAHLRQQLWEIWRPLGASLDLSDSRFDAGAMDRCRTYIGELPAAIEHRAIWVATGSIPNDGAPTTGSLVQSPMGTLDGSEGDRLVRLSMHNWDMDSGDELRSALERNDKAITAIKSEVQKRLGWVPWDALRPHRSSPAWAKAIGDSFGVAIWERMLARGMASDSKHTGPTGAVGQAFIASAGELYSHHLSLAELLLSAEVR
jgi:hypothetical protein